MFGVNHWLQRDVFIQFMSGTIVAKKFLKSEIEGKKPTLPGF